MDAVTEPTVKYYRRVRVGPEYRLETAVASTVDQWMKSSSYPRWMAGYLAVGAGMPDLLVVQWNPKVVALAKGRLSDSAILGYLRAVGSARLETIIARLRGSPTALADSLTALVDANVVSYRSRSFFLDEPWRAILPEIVSVEAKVTDWRRALAQAARNSVFCHRSFIALPSSVAERVALDKNVKRLGIGILAVDSLGDVVVARDAIVHRPKVWGYYYHLAHHVALSAAEAACPS